MSIPRSSRPFLFALAMAVVFGSARHAGATSVTSTTFSSWKTGITGSPTEADFSTIALTSYNTASGLTLKAVGNSSIGFTFTGPDRGSYQMTGTKLSGYPALTGSTDSGAGLNVAMPTGGVNAFLLSIGTSGGTPISITLSDGETFVSSAGLFGMSVSHPVSSLLLTTSAGSAVLVNDFYFGTSNLTQDPTGSGGTDVSASAEVATWLMMAGGCLILFGAVRKFNPIPSA